MTYDPTLYPRYLAKAEAAFAERDRQQRLAAMSDDALCGGITAALNQLEVNNIEGLSRPYTLPTERMHASDALRRAAAGEES